MSCLFILCFRCFSRRKHPKTTSVIWKDPATQTLELAQSNEVIVAHVGNAAHLVLHEHTIIDVKEEYDTQNTTINMTDDIKNDINKEGTTHDDNAIAVLIVPCPVPTFSSVVFVPCPCVSAPSSPVDVPPPASVVSVPPLVPCPAVSSESNFSDFVIVNNSSNVAGNDMDSESDDTREYINILNSITIPLNEPIPSSLTFSLRQTSSVHAFKKTQ